MLLSTKDGIRCDVCASEFRMKFEYYSIECKKVEVRIGAAFPQPHLDLDIEVCQTCYDYFYKKCLDNVGDVRRNSVKCDLCPRYFTNEFNYWRAGFVKVLVDSEVEPSTTTERVDFDLNIGEKCFEKIQSKVDQNRAAPETQSNWSMEG